VDSVLFLKTSKHVVKKQKSFSFRRKNLECKKLIERFFVVSSVIRCVFLVLRTVFKVDMYDFDQRTRWAELTGGRTGRFTKTLKMVKSAYVNLCLHGLRIFGMG
jgi:hypothetical protein